MTVCPCQTFRFQTLAGARFLRLDGMLRNSLKHFSEDRLRVHRRRGSWPARCACNQPEISLKFQTHFLQQNRVNGGRDKRSNTAGRHKSHSFLFTVAYDRELRLILFSHGYQLSICEIERSLFSLLIAISPSVS